MLDSNSKVLWRAKYNDALAPLKQGGSDSECKTILYTTFGSPIVPNIDGEHIYATQ